MAPPPGSLLLLAHLSFDFERGTIAGEDGVAVGSLRWRRRPGARFAADLGAFDDRGEVAWWVRPKGPWGLSPDGVLTPEGELVGDISMTALRVGGSVLAALEQQRFPFYLPEWRIVGDRGLLGEVRREQRWVTGETRRREVWHVHLEPSAVGPLRYLAAAAPYACSRKYHSA